jgi:TusA-related sulfurtransferase
MPAMDSDSAATECLDLRGVRCPLNWARARVRLEELPRGAQLVLLVDDPRAVRDVPRAAEACGYVVAEVSPVAQGGWTISIIK